MALWFWDASALAKRYTVAADRRLVRASAAEGLQTVNPEETAPVDVPELVASA